MNKYEQVNNNYPNINNILFEGETVIWQGKPKKSAFIINKNSFYIFLNLGILLKTSFFVFHITKNKTYA